MTGVLSSCWTAFTQRMSIIWYFIMPKLFFVCVSQLFLVNPDQLACQYRVTDTVDLKAISRPAVCNSTVSFPPTSSVYFLSPSLVSSATRTHFPFIFLSGLTSIPHMTPKLLFDTVLTVFLWVPSLGFMTHIIHFPACQLPRQNLELSGFYGCGFRFLLNLM